MIITVTERDISGALLQQIDIGRNATGGALVTVENAEGEARIITHCPDNALSIGGALVLSKALTEAIYLAHAISQGVDPHELLPAEAWESPTRL